MDYAYISKIDYLKCRNIYWKKTEFGYARGYLNGKEWLLHKYITDTNEKILIDHIDRNKLNCVRNNLRFANKSINSLNRDTPSNSTTGITGVSYDKKKRKYRSYIKTGGKQIFLGYFNFIEDAAKARSEAFIKMFGNDIYNGDDKEE